MRCLPSRSKDEFAVRPRNVESTDLSMRKPAGTVETKRGTRYEIRQATPADVAELIRMNVALQESMIGS